MIRRFLSLFRRRDPASDVLTTGDTGRLAEAEALRYFKKHGFRVLRKNLKDRNGELDLVLREKRGYEGVIVVEVRSFKPRPNWTYSDALPPSKKRQVCESARRLLPKAGLWKPGESLRFDAAIVEVNDKGEVVALQHFPNDFSPEDSTRF